MYAGNTSNTQPISVAMTEEQEEEMEKVGIEESEELINVDGTKIKLSSKVIKVSSRLGWVLTRYRGRSRSAVFILSLCVEGVFCSMSVRVMIQNIH